MEHILEEVYKKFKEMFYRMELNKKLNVSIPSQIRGKNIPLELKEFNKAYRRYKKSARKDLLIYALYKDILVLDYVILNKKKLRMKDLITTLAQKKLNLYRYYLNILQDEYKSILKNNSILKEILEILNNISKETYLVGGCVRDGLLNKKPKDFDIVTNVPYDKMFEIFKTENYNIKEVGKEFLVLMVTKNNISFEIANFRKDGTYTDGRRPNEVQIGTICDDAERRDFTINALYYNPLENVLYDPTYQGLYDIDNRILRFVGKPEDRINEDYLRGWRYMRFLKTLNAFNPDKKSLQGVRSNWNKIYNNSNPERVRIEIEKMIEFGNG